MVHPSPLLSDTEHRYADEIDEKNTQLRVQRVHEKGAGKERSMRKHECGGENERQAGLQN